MKTIIKCAWTVTVQLYIAGLCDGFTNDVVVTLIGERAYGYENVLTSVNGWN